ncbi:putative DUF1168 domain protein [Rhypophila decipiens]
MSAPGPESIPTSADKRSQRPLKKRKMPANPNDPASLQAATVSSLFANPTQEIKLPPPVDSLSSGKKLPPPPEIVTNVQGSSAGAGSGEFHVYKAARRREYERLRLMDEEVAREKARDEFERNKRENEAKDEEKTRKNREKREKKKKNAEEAAKRRKMLKEKDEKKQQSNGDEKPAGGSGTGENRRGGGGGADSSRTAFADAKHDGSGQEDAGVENGMIVDDNNNNNNNNNNEATAITKAAGQGRAGQGRSGRTVREQKPGPKEEEVVLLP